LGRRALVSAIIAAVAGAFGVTAFFWDRYHQIGTRAEWRTGRGLHELFSTSPSGPVTTIGALGPAFAVVFVVCLFLTLKNSRATASPR
jgi:hypothetical protein